MSSWSLLPLTKIEEATIRAYGYKPYAKLQGTENKYLVVLENGLFNILTIERSKEK